MEMWCCKRRECSLMNAARANTCWGCGAKRPAPQAQPQVPIAPDANAVLVSNVGGAEGG